MHSKAGSQDLNHLPVGYYASASFASGPCMGASRAVQCLTTSRFILPCSQHKDGAKNSVEPACRFHVPHLPRISNAKNNPRRALHLP